MGFHWCFISIRPDNGRVISRSGSILAQVMAYHLATPSHYLNQSQILICDVLCFQLRAISQQVLKLLFYVINLKIILLTLLPHLPGANELKHNTVTSSWVVSNHQPHGCLFNCLFRHRSKNTSKLRITGLCAGNLPVTGEFPAQRTSYAENVSIWWHHDGQVADTWI